MSTALLHHQRSHLIAAAAAVVAIGVVGVGLEVSRDNPSASTETPGPSTSAPHFRLTGSSNESGNWHHAGTTSGGHVLVEP
jgi:hypothetical protein